MLGSLVVKALALYAMSPGSNPGVKFQAHKSVFFFLPQSGQNGLEKNRLSVKIRVRMQEST